MGYNRPESIVVLSLLSEFNVFSFSVKSDNSGVSEIQINFDEFKKLNAQYQVVNTLITDVTEY